MNIIDLTNLSHEELVEREMKEQNITREEAEKYWQNTYEAAKENQKQHDEFMEQYYNEKTADQLLSNRSSNLKIKITEFRKEYPDVSKFNLAKYLGDIYREEKELNMDFLQYLFSLDLDFNSTSEKGMNAFCIGLLLKNIELTKLFISKGIDIKKPIIYKPNKNEYLQSEEYKYKYPYGKYRDEIEVTPFNFACMTNYFENIVILIENNIDVYTPIYRLHRLKIGIIDDDPITVYDLAIDWNNNKLLKYLIQLNKFYDDNDKLLLKVIEKYNIEIIELLISLRKNNDIYHPNLTSIIKYKNLPLLKKLVDSGAQLNEEYNEFGFYHSYLEICIKNDESMTFNLDKKDEDKFFNEYSYFDIAEYLLAKGINPNQGNSNPLMVSLNIEEKMLSNLVDLGMNYGFKINYRMANLLIENRADVNYSDLDGISILMSACEPKFNFGDYSEINKKIDLINLLIKNGANVNHKDKNGNSVIMHIDDDDSEKAYYEENFTDEGQLKERIVDLEIYPSEKILRLLLEKGANINTRNNFGMTPLMHFSYKGQDRLVKILLENGADINVKSEVTAFDLAQNDEIKSLIQNSKNNDPQKLVKLLSNFTIDKPIKYTTHDWDFGELKKEYKDFDGYMEAIKKQFESMKEELENLSPNLHNKIYTFLLEENPNDDYSWCHKTHINIGWSSLKGLKEHCDADNKPNSFVLSSPLFYEGKDLTTFGDIISLFKQEIEIRENFKNLETMFNTQKKSLGKGRNSTFNLDLTTSKLNRQFYTDVEMFSNALTRIFTEIKVRQDFPNIEVYTNELEDRSIEIKIVHIESFPNKSANDLLKEIDDGDFAEIKSNLQNLCDWSIESCFENENFRINYLHSNNVKDIEKTNKVSGFTHIFRFYK